MHKCTTEMCPKIHSPPGKNIADADRELVHRFFSSVGLTLEGEEKSLDAVVGLSGSAPAYVSCIFILFYTYTQCQATQMARSPEFKMITNR